MTTILRQNSNHHFLNPKNNCCHSLSPKEFLRISHFMGDSIRDIRLGNTVDVNRDISNIPNDIDIF